jgi:hypothetical protein
MLKVLACCSTLLVAVASSAAAQLISIRTVPVSQAHQFEIFPSRTIGMAGISIAVNDSLLDPFVNPAKGARIGAARFFGSPSTYSVSSGAGGGRSLPIGAMARNNDWFGGVWMALQEVDMSNRNDLFPVPPPCAACNQVNEVSLPRFERSQGNTYAFALAGRELSPGVSIGGSVMWSELNAIDGVDLLYNGSARIDQFGHSLDVRVGGVKEFAGDRSIEALVLHNRFGTTHDVFYLDGFWDPGVQQFSQRARLEKNLDRTNTWGLHLNYDQPISVDGWRAGALFTVNRMDHPKIPNYAIMNIPRDPGNSSAFNAGMGISRTRANSTFGVDVVYEPIWSHTWADAANPIETTRGETIPAGGMTIENHFRFSNAVARFGVEQNFTIGQNGPMGGFQLGLGVRRISYRLEQKDHIQITERRLAEHWVESTPTWGFNMQFPNLEVRYSGSVTNGTGRPGVGVDFGRGIAVADAAVGSNILAAPSGPLTLDEVKVTTHQISISLPVR